MTAFGAEIAQRLGVECKEMSERAFEGPGSIVLDQVENRTHMIKAVLFATIGS